MRTITRFDQITKKIKEDRYNKSSVPFTFRLNKKNALKLYSVALERKIPITNLLRELIEDILKDIVV